MKNFARSHNLHHILISNRRCGYTTWLLKAALLHPPVVILAHTQKYAETLCRRYADIYRALPWWLRAWWAIRKFFGFPRPQTKIMSIISFEVWREGRKPVPVMYDNSTLLDAYDSL